MYMSVHICAYVIRVCFYIYVCTYRCMRVRLYGYTYMYVHINACVCLYVYVCTYICIYMLIRIVCVCIYVG